MKHRADPRRITIDGQEFVLLDPVMYERLEASRRQHGAQTGQMAQLRERLKQATRQLDAVRRVLDQADATCETARTARAALDTG